MPVWNMVGICPLPLSSILLVPLKATVFSTLSVQRALIGIIMKPWTRAETQVSVAAILRTFSITSNNFDFVSTRGVLIVLEVDLSEDKCPHIVTEPICVQSTLQHTRQILHLCNKLYIHVCRVWF